MAQKFTPYALTALPSIAGRDVNGIYFIRTPNGMKVYAIANNLNRTPVELQVDGYVDLTNSQTIYGTKTFRDAVTLYTASFFETANSNELKLTLQKLGAGSGNAAGLYAVHDNKRFLLDMQDLDMANSTTLKIVPLNGTTQNTTELGWKRIYPFNSAVTLTSGSNYSINIVSNIDGWDFNESVHLKSYGNWDITWFAGSVYRSLKSEYSWDSGNALKALELGVSTLGIFLRGGNKGRTITIPFNANLIFW
ncbi:MAG: hypothetical protein WCY77_09930 [Weeksellaceae bacterium]